MKINKCRKKIKNTAMVLYEQSVTHHVFNATNFQPVVPILERINLEEVERRNREQLEVMNEMKDHLFGHFIDVQHNMVLSAIVFACSIYNGLNNTTFRANSLGMYKDVDLEAYEGAIVRSLSFFIGSILFFCNLPFARCFKRRIDDLPVITYTFRYVNTAQLTLMCIGVCYGFHAVVILDNFTTFGYEVIYASFIISCLLLFVYTGYIVYRLIGEIRRAFQLNR